MKFKVGDDVDRALCVAIRHEFLRCDDAFKEFAKSAELMIMRGENRRIAYTTYNAYARFIHHLYEFLLGAIQRDRNDTGKLHFELADKYVQGYAQRVVTNRREAILNGTAPSWENHISVYPERIPAEFASRFKLFRNTASGHVKHQRTGMSMS
ncbi:hypothetical protein, partial [Ralstonia solanacearum]|uniref:hypothetical protein n=1 Tax=Ralstonia solanacearum TaxID=305 RepID=UPI0012D3AD9B